VLSSSESEPEPEESSELDEPPLLMGVLVRVAVRVVPGSHDGCALSLALALALELPSSVLSSSESEPEPEESSELDEPPLLMGVLVRVAVRVVPGSHDGCALSLALALALELWPPSSSEELPGFGTGLEDGECDGKMVVLEGVGKQLLPLNC
jgi:hypothetical protein